MKKHVLNCTCCPINGRYAVIIKDVCGGHTMRVVLSDRPVKAGTDVMVREDRVVFQ